MRAKSHPDIESWATSTVATTFSKSCGFSHFLPSESKNKQSNENTLTC